MVCAVRALTLALALTLLAVSPASAVPITVDLRRDFYWRAYFAFVQFGFTQSRRGLQYYELGWAKQVRSNLAQYPSARRWWEEGKQSYLPEFVEWVEEQRSKAA